MESETTKYRIVKIEFNSEDDEYAIEHKPTGILGLFEKWKERKYREISKMRAVKRIKELIESDNEEYGGKVKKRTILKF